MVEEIVDDESLDGRVLSQDPEGGTDAEQGTTVVIVVGRFEQAPPAETTTTRPRPAVTRRIRVAVVAGGRSSEHEISLASARSVLEALDPERYETTTIAIGRDGRWALEGPSNSLLQGHVDGNAAGARRLQAGGGDRLRRRRPARPARPVRRGRHRAGPARARRTCRTSEPASPPPRSAWTRTSSRPCSAIAASRSLGTRRCGSATRSRIPFGYPVFVKPARLGSSVGISKAHDEAELETAVALARRHDEKVLVEEFVAGTEVECGVLGNLRPAPIASVVGEIVPHGEWYDYAAKYDVDGSDIIVPARIPDETAARVQALAVDSFIATECEGMARVDFFVREDGEVVVNELNTIPGFTATSVYARLFEASGIPYAELLDRLIQLALERHERRSGLEY